MTEQLEVMGLPAEVVEEQAAREAEVMTFGIHQDNVTTLVAFLALRTQWRLVAGGMGPPMVQGIEYASIPPVLELLDVPESERKDVFAGIRAMEAAALPILNARDNAETGGRNGG